MAIYGLTSLGKEVKTETFQMETDGELYFGNKGYKEALKDVVTDCTMHGIKYFYVAETGRKIIWVVLVIAAIAAVTVQMEKQLTQYIYPTVTTSMDMTYLNEMPFPTILICNSNLYRISAASKFQVYNMISKVYTRLGDPQNNHNPMTLSSYSDSNTVSFNSTQDILVALGHKIEDMLVPALYFSSMSSNLDGTPLHFKEFEPFITDYGLCYQYNSNETIIATEAGSKASLNFYINLEMYDYMAGPADTTSLKVLLYNKIKSPFVSIYQDAIDVTPGFVSIIGATYHEEERLNVADGGSCVDSAPMAFFPKDKYNVFTCKLDAYFDEVNKSCNCIPVFNFPSNESCNITQYFGCALFKDSSSALLNKTCQQSCTASYYRHTLSLGRIPDKVVTAFQKNSSKFLEHYNRSMEAKVRNEEDLVTSVKNLTQDCFNAVGEARAFHLLPNDTSWLSNFDRINQTSTTFQTMVSAVVGFSHYTSGSSSNSQPSQGPQNHQATQVTVQTLFNGLDNVMNSSQQSIFNITSEKSLGRAKELFLAWTSSHWEDFFLMFNATSSAYLQSQNNNQQQHTQTISQLFPNDFNLLMAYLNSFKVGKMTKKEFADMNRQPPLASDPPFSFAGQLVNLYMAGYCKNFTVLENMRDYLEWFGNDNVTQMVFNHLNDSTENSWFWTVFTYSATAKYQINTTCGSSTTYLGFFQDNSTNGMASQQNPMQQSSTGDGPCYMPMDYTPYMQMFDVLQKNMDQLLNDVSNILNRKDGICVDMERAFRNLDNDLGNYLTNWNFDNTFWRDNLLGVKIYLSELSFETITQTASYTFFSLICDIGGSLGLFLGASLLTFFELVDLLVCSCYWKWKKRRSNNQIHKQRIEAPIPDVHALYY